jgi:N-acetylmuramoyl-L-alanine amidase
VAIDVEQEVKFNSQRIAGPDRIFFDILDTKLASTLVGKTFDVDDGFLKKIRVAENKPGQTRIVLEVDNLSSYDAFLLPDPYRLIIDIHGKQGRTPHIAKAQSGDGSLGTGDEISSSADDATSSDSDANDVMAEPVGPVKKEKEHAIVAKVEDEDSGDETSAEKRSESLKEELAKESAGGESAGAGNSGIVKTTTVVKGTNRTIPKTIVAADGDRAAGCKGSQHGCATQNHRGLTPRQSDHAQSQHGTVRPGANKDDGATDPVENAKLTNPDDAISEAPALSSPSAATASAPATNLKTPSRRKKSSRSAASTPADEDTADVETREAQPMAAGNRSLTRALGLKIGKIVIDAGHGGHDTGTIGPNGLLEKDVVLDVAKRLGRLLETRMGAEVIYTRHDDTFIPLETRTAIANRAQADLFISIHANSSQDEDARGVETYYLNFTSSPEALEVAARENAVSEKSIHELQDLVKKIALKEKIEESREFASDVQDSLYGGLALNNVGIRNRGVKKAPFIVLIGANMPSILAEISFVSNPTDARKLLTSEHRQRIAESLYRGVSRYAGGLSGVKVASKMTKGEGQ